MDSMASRDIICRGWVLSVPIEELRIHICSFTGTIIANIEVLLCGGSFGFVCI